MVWMPVEGFEGHYEVNELGEVRSRKTGHYRKMKPKHNKFTGYDYLILHKDGSSKTISIHRIVATAFVPNPDGLPQINHIDENKTNNRADNLEWCTAVYNVEYSKHKRYKPVDVFALDGEKLATFTSSRSAAEFLGVSKGAVSSALSGGKTCIGFRLEYAKEI